MRSKKVLALIPARGGSKGLPRKNLVNLCGKPLIAWTILQARFSSIIDRVVVSTDDEEIASVAKSFGAEVPFIRPAELASDEASSVDVIAHAVKELGGTFSSTDILVLLEPTSPLRKSADIDMALKKYFDASGEVDSLVSVGQITLEHPCWAKKINGDSIVDWVTDGNSTAARRQLLPPAYFPYGVIYASTIGAVLEHRTFFQRRTLGYLIERWQCYEIDDLCDLTCVEAIFRKFMKN